MKPRILLLGGTGEALQLARTLGAETLYSLAGLGRVPHDLACAVRVGGFGGAEGLARFLAVENIELLLDLSHPYAAQISANAADASRRSGIPCWALRRPAWQARPGDDWREVDGWNGLMAALAAFRRPFFTCGREPLAHLQEIPAQQHWTIRCLDSVAAPANAEVIATRGPFLLDEERTLFARLACDVLVSKNSGGAATEAKLQVARERALPVLLLRRPALPPVTREFDDPRCLREALEAFFDTP